MEIMNTIWTFLIVHWWLPLLVALLLMVLLFIIAETTDLEIHNIKSDYIVIYSLLLLLIMANVLYSYKTHTGILSNNRLGIWLITHRF